MLKEHEVECYTNMLVDNIRAGSDEAKKVLMEHIDNSMRYLYLHEAGVDNWEGYDLSEYFENE